MNLTDLGYTEQLATYRKTENLESFEVNEIYTGNINFTYEFHETFSY